MKQTILSIILMLLPLLASADAVEIDGIYYNLVKKVKSAEVTSNPNYYSGSVVIPEKVEYEGTEYKVTSIGGSAFYGCSGLTSIAIPNSVTIIGNGAFENCIGLTSVTIPNSVTSIGGSAFYNCSGLTSITIPNSVTSIGENAFSYCYGLTSITIPNSVTSIGECAFFWCSGLTSITIPSSVTSIGNYAFCLCSDLTSITIPNSVTSIGNYAFSGCSGLTSIKVEAGNTLFDSRDNCNAIIETASNTLIAGCQNTKIPNGVTSIGVEAFADCSGLTSITIPNSVTSIGEYALFGCSSLTSITIGSGIETINSQAFAKCPELTDVYCYAENVPNTESDAFQNSYIEYATLHVPVASISSYQAREPWKNFKSIVKIVPVGSVCLDKSEAILEKGKTMTLKATVYPETLEDKSVTWESSDTKVATVTSSGKVKGIKAGIVTITCTSVATGATATCDLTVGYVKLDKAEATLEKGESVVLTPTVYPSKLPDRSVTWESSDTKIATVSSSGKVKGVNAGIATITCTSVATGLSTTCIVTVNGVSLGKSEAILEKGKTMMLKPTFYPETLEDKSVTWKSSNTAVATVSSTGKVKGVKAGIVTITCTSVATGATATCDLTVGYVKLDKTEATLEKGETVTLTPTVYPSKLTDRSVTWKSSDETIATVTSSGKVKGVNAGIATITSTSVATGLSTTCTVTVNGISLGKSEAILEKGKTMTLKPTFYPETLEDKSVTWKSSNTAVATVSSTGKVKGVKAGIVTITCTSVATGATATCDLTVGYVKLDKTEVAVKKNKTVTLTPTVYPSKLEDRSVTWKSSDETIATVTSDGKVKGVKYGTATITCTSNATGLSTTCTVTVGTVYLDIAEVTIHNGGALTLTSTVYPNTLTDKSVTWKSSDNTIATVTSAGKVRGVNVGTATITCTSVATGLSSTCKVTVIEFAGARFVYEDDDDVTGIETLDETPAVEEPFDVYDLRGRKVMQRVTSLDGLPVGVYIINGKKVMKR